MSVEWKTLSVFNEDFITVGDWDFSSISKFPHIKYVACDTETKLYYNNELLTEERAYELYKQNGAKWCRSNIVVDAYAFTIANGTGFALFQNAEDFLTALAMLNVKLCFWYNAKFDFAILDYFFLTNDWKESDDAIEENKEQGHYGKIGDKHYQSLNGDFGQRYQMRVWKSYRNRSSHIKVRNFKMIDICNIFSGGLRKNLEDWGIVDNLGEDVRKLEMDYVNASIENDLQYMINDTKGLYLLVEKINETMFQNSGYSLFDGDYITAGGLAKKSLLKYMFGKTDKENKKLFQYYFPMSVEDDMFYRDYHLYQGGKCFVNPYKVGKIQSCVYKYDENSMYPHKMKTMLYPIGKGKKLKNFPEDTKGKIYVLMIHNIKGTLKENKVPVWYDTLDGEYKAKIFQEEPLLIWNEELEEIKLWYDINYEIDYVLEFDAWECKGAKEFVDFNYEIKANSTGSKKNGAKLQLNSAYGKLAQKIERVKCDYKLSDEGYVHLVKSQPELDAEGMLSVLLGSRITALARVHLMFYMRKICGPDIKKDFVYCDTDSVHSLKEYLGTDAKELGKMKCEGKYLFAFYLAPKTYMMYNIDSQGKYEYEVHCKGVNTDVVLKQVSKYEDFKIASQYFNAGIPYRCLCALNVKGGKALIYIDKMLLQKKRLKIIDDDEIID